MNKFDREIEEFIKNPPYEVLERMRKAYEKRKQNTPVCSCFVDRHSFNCFWHKRLK